MPVQKGYLADLAKDLQKAYEDRNKSLMHFNHWLKMAQAAKS